MKNVHKTSNFSPTAQQPNSPTAQQNKLNFKWLLFCLIFLLFSSSKTVYAQCTIHTADLQNFSGSTTATNVQTGQTFLPCANGEITSISIGFAVGSAAGNYELYISEEPGITTFLPAIPVATVPVSSPLASDQILTFNLTTSFAVSMGTLYRFAFTNISGNNNVKLSAPGDYPDGDGVGTSGNPTSDFDLDFEVNIQPTSSTPASIPTLSEWGLIILALLLMTLGTLYLLQPKFRGGIFEQER